LIFYLKSRIRFAAIRLKGEGMRPPRIFYCAIIFFFWTPQISFAFDWIKLHEKADHLTSADAQKTIIENSDATAGLYVSALVYLNQYKTLQLHQ
jgi:hypothetical protein